MLAAAACCWRNRNIHAKPFKWRTKARQALQVEVVSNIIRAYVKSSGDTQTHFCKKSSMWKKSRTPLHQRESLRGDPSISIRSSMTILGYIQFMWQTVIVGIISGQINPTSEKTWHVCWDYSNTMQMRNFGQHVVMSMTNTTLAQAYDWTLSLRTLYRFCVATQQHPSECPCMGLSCVHP